MSLLRWGFKRQHGCDRGANKHYCITVMTTVTTYNVSKQHFIYLKFTQCYKTNRSIKTTKIFKRHTHTQKKKTSSVSSGSLQITCSRGREAMSWGAIYKEVMWQETEASHLQLHVCSWSRCSNPSQVYWNYSPSWASWLNPHEGHWARLLPDPQKPLS